MNFRQTHTTAVAAAKEANGVRSSVRNWRASEMKLRTHNTLII